MSDKNSQKVGSLSEKACGLEMEKYLQELGYNIVSGLDPAEFESEVAKGNFEGKEGEDQRFAIAGGRALAGRIVEDVHRSVHSKGYEVKDYEVEIRDTSKDACLNLETDDLCATFTHKVTGETFSFPLSLKTKSKSGNRIDGSSSANNPSFLNRVFKGTDLIDSDALAKVDDSVARSEWKATIKMLKEAGEKCTPDYASKVYNENRNDGECWKKVAKENLGDVIEEVLNKSEAKAHTSTIIRNILDLGGFKPGTHLALALREKNKLQTTHLYTSIHCPIYKKIASGEAKSVEVIKNRNGGFGGFKIDGFILKLDYVPSGMKLMVNPLVALKIK